MRLIFLGFLLLTGCGRSAPPPVAVAAPVAACSGERFEGSRFTVCDPGKGRIELISSAPDAAPYRRFALLAQGLGERADRVAFAMNAGMFDDAGEPIGLLVEQGRQLHAINRRKGFGNFHLMPNGVFLVRKDGRAAVVGSEAWRPARDIVFATQSGPMLLIAGKLHPKIDPDGSSLYIRNAVGVRPDGRALFVISDEAVSFGRLARMMREKLGVRDALYLDGSVSSLWDPAGARQDEHAPLGPMIVAFKPAASTPGP